VKGEKRDKNRYYLLGKSRKNEKDRDGDDSSFLYLLTRCVDPARGRKERKKEAIARLRKPFTIFAADEAEKGEDRL